MLRRALAGARGERFVVALARALGLELVPVAYRSAGILNYQTQEASGERFLVEAILPVLLAGSDGEPILFDVGANVGEFALALRARFPLAQIVAFEPNPATFRALEAAVALAGARCVPAGLGSRAGEAQLSVYRDDPRSGHASLHAGVFGIYRGYGIAQAEHVVEVSCAIRTLDEFCASEGVGRVDFLKIDVEGHEIEVLRGAARMLREGRVGAIQFEFTDCNVVTRVFLRDFYELLPGRSFFRLLPAGLLPLGQHAARHEIFQFQNILALDGAATVRVAPFISAEGR
jgi:FkbM family methyltransferase